MGFPSIQLRFLDDLRKCKDRWWWQAESSSMNAKSVVPQSISTWYLISLPWSWRLHVMIRWFQLISFWSTIAKPDKHNLWRGDVGPMCVLLSAHGTSSLSPIWRKEGQHMQAHYWLPQGLSVLWRHWTGRELRRPHFHIVGIYRDVYWNLLTPYGQSRHSISIVLLGSSFSIPQVLRFFGWHWDP
jgi:hypothetical protein